MRQNDKIKLLSPVGSMESLYSAVNNGCDEVYLGGKAFNARHYASNFSDEELEDIIDFCHLRGVKVLITLNILYKENEINSVLEFVSKIYSYGADALIIQDIGIFNIIKQNYPDIRLHASTQMTIHNIYGVKFIEKLGYNRIVLSRELSLSEIKNISSKTNMELEIFIHGALCVSYSGRCLMSSIIGERSGNRGKCAQPCRLKYKLIKDGNIINNNYLLSPKDMSAANHISELINSGVSAFKIEGRMKSPEYVAEVTKFYRKYIDYSYENENNKKIEINQNDKKELIQIFNRGGKLTDGYLLKWAGSDMISSSPKSSGIKIGKVINYNTKTEIASIKLIEPVIPGDGIEIWTKNEPHIGTNITEKAPAGSIISIKLKGNILKNDLVFKSFDKELDDKLKKEYKKDIRKNKIIAELYAEIDKPIKLVLELNNIKIETTGALIKKAKNSPIEKEEILKRLSKTGNTPFLFDFKKVVCNENIYISISDINTLRRNAISNFSEKLKNKYKRPKILVKYKRKEREINNIKKISVSVQTEEQFFAALNSSVEKIYIEFNNIFIKNTERFINEAKSNSKEIYLFTPIILREPFFEEFNNIIKNLEKSKLDGYVVRNLGEFKTDKKIIGDYTLNAYNSISVSFFKKIFSSITISPELNINELYNLCENGTEIYLYGRLPLMTTHQCPIGLYDSEKKSGIFCSKKYNNEKYFLKDRKSTLFPVYCNCNICTATILNSSPIFVLNRINEILKIPFETMRLSFTIENQNEAIKIINAHEEAIKNVDMSLESKKLIEHMKNKGFTNGHFFRGVL